MHMADLALKDVKKSYGKVDIIKGVDLDIKHGEFIVFVGPSGCGKSTLLRMIAGLEDITAGTIAIGNKVVNDLQPKDRSIAMVFQSYALFPHMTVRENVAFGLKIAGESRDSQDKKVAEAARMLKLEPLLDRKPSQLSGGQRQRVAIGRAIVRTPEVFLFDEPLSNLDAALRVGTRAEIAKLHRELGATMVYVTHDQVEAMTLADRIVVLEAGHVRQFGTPMDLYHYPDNVFVAGFIGSPKMNFISVEATSAGNAKGVTVSGTGVKNITAQVDAARIAKGQKLSLGIRPEHVRVTPGGKGLMSGTVQLLERLGNQTFMEVVSSTGQSITALMEGDHMLDIGDTISITFEGENCHLFNADGQSYARPRKMVTKKPRKK
jgi:multiple sugar transport system ATP-binding protein